MRVVARPVKTDCVREARLLIRQDKHPLGEDLVGTTLARIPVQVRWHGTLQ